MANFKAEKVLDKMRLILTIKFFFLHLDSPQKSKSPSVEILKREKGTLGPDG